MEWILGLKDRVGENIFSLFKSTELSNSSCTYFFLFNFIVFNYSNSFLGEYAVYYLFLVFMKDYFMLYCFIVSFSLLRARFNLINGKTGELGPPTLVGIVFAVYCDGFGD